MNYSVIKKITQSDYNELINMLITKSTSLEERSLILERLLELNNQMIEIKKNNHNSWFETRPTPSNIKRSATENFPPGMQYRNHETHKSFQTPSQTNVSDRLARIQQIYTSISPSQRDNLFN